MIVLSMVIGGLSFVVCGCVARLLVDGLLACSWCVGFDGMCGTLWRSCTPGSR